MKVLVAMSGGVDSSAVAALLAQQGHEVTGVHLRLSEEEPDAEGRTHGCCGVTDADDARRVAQVLDIPFYVWSMREEFSEGVIDQAVNEYASGRTPNPCVRCNEKVKFGLLLDRSIALGFDALATGHYARLVACATGKSLMRAKDKQKDQSYVLARTPQERLARCLFPLGDMLKEEVRAFARESNLRTAMKPESFDLCFVADGDLASFVGARLEPKPGSIVDEDGNAIGEHSGVHGFTVGQRRGLGLASNRRLHVIDIDPTSSTVKVGAAALLDRTEIEADEVVWTQGGPTPFDSVQVRAHGGIAPATLVEGSTDRLLARLDQPLRGVAPGQLVACYRGEEVVAGGTIAATR